MELSGYVTGGLGLVAIGTGAALGVLALDTHTRFETATGSKRDSLASSGRTYALSADVLLGVGAGALVAGLVMVIVGGGSEAPPGEVSWQPVGHVGPDGVSFGVGGRW